MTKLARAPAGYETDFHAWLTEQAALLRAGAVDGLDRENIAEELETLGRSDKRALGSHLRNIMLHLLKMQFQPEKRTQSWRQSVRSSRDEIATILADSPSLARALPELFAPAYRRALADAIDETALQRRVFPKMPPFTLEQMLGDEPFAPEEDE